ncbi:hypothetical protein Tco_1134002 [Tanacetum coccineum]
MDTALRLMLARDRPRHCMCLMPGKFTWDKESAGVSSCLGNLFKAFKVEANLGIRVKASNKLISKFISLKIS